MTGHVVVFGSANIDLVVPVQQHPVPGETVLGGTLRRSPGGKGANQSVAAARGGHARTSFIGVLGRDEHGEILRRSLTDAGVDLDVVRESDSPTGTALITVSADGENTIVVAPGANGELGAPVGETADRVARADVLLAQLEVPLPAILGAAQALRPEAVFIVNAAPSRELPAEIWDRLDVLVVNEHEAIALADGHAEAIQAATTLTARVGAVVLTLGARGAVIMRDGAEPVMVPAPRVRVVDTTGAGDTFCGVFAAALAEGLPMVGAAQRAVAAGALAVTRAGAQQAVPSAEELDNYLTEHRADKDPQDRGESQMNVGGAAFHRFCR